MFLCLLIYITEINVIHYNMCILFVQLVKGMFVTIGM